MFKGKKTMTYSISPCNVLSCINFTETGEWRADIIITELRSNSYYVSVIGLLLKVEIFLEQREVAFLSPSKICENLNFSVEIQFLQILLGDKNATSLCSKNISTLSNNPITET